MRVPEVRGIGQRDKREGYSTQFRSDTYDTGCCPRDFAARKRAVGSHCTPPAHSSYLCRTTTGHIRRSRAKGPRSALSRSEQAKTRIVKINVYELPKPVKAPPPPVTAMAPTSGGGIAAAPDAYPTTYSVCTSLGGLRVAVMKDKDDKTFTCSRPKCRG